MKSRFAETYFKTANTEKKKCDIFLKELRNEKIGEKTNQNNKCKFPF